MKSEWKHEWRADTKELMKSEGKYILSAMAIILLIVLGGVLYNYSVYFKSPYGHLAEIYGDGGLDTKSDGIYYGDHWLERPTEDYASELISLSTDDGSYAPDGVIRVRIENNSEMDMEFYSAQYMLKMKIKDDWYIIHTGEIDEDGRGELMQCAPGGSHEFEVRLDSVREVGEGELMLEKGEYMLCKSISIREGGGEPTEAWLTSEFVVE